MSNGTPACARLLLCHNTHPPCRLTRLPVCLPACAQALAAVCKGEEDPRLASLDRRALAKVMAFLLGQPPHSEPVLAALTVVASLARATPNR